MPSFFMAAQGFYANRLLSIFRLIRILPKQRFLIVYPDIKKNVPILLDFSLMFSNMYTSINI